MTLVDTSVWIEHFRKGDAELELLLEAEQVLLHPFVLGELGLGSWKDREGLMGRLAALAPAPMAEEGEVQALVQRHRLWGKGLGWVDCHLLASARQCHAHLLSRDKALKSAWVGVRRAA